MPSFNYVGKGQDGRNRSGTVEASSGSRAVEVLREQGITVVSIKEIKAGFNLNGLLKRFKKPSDKEKAVFTRQLSTMMGAGLPLTQALSILRDQSGDSQFGDILEYVQSEVQGGKPLSESLARFPDVFSKTYISLTQAAEASGAIKEVLIRLAENLEKQGKLRSSIIGALLYPVLVIAAMGGVGGIMMVFVIPKLKVMYESFEADLPFVTKIFIGISDLLVQKWWLFVVLVPAAIFALKKFKETERGQYLWSKLLFRIPVMGPLYQETQLVEITRTLSLLLSSGVPIVDAIRIAHGSTGNIIYQDVLALAAVQVERGETLASPFRASRYFPPIVSRMMAVGEESGETGTVLGRLADFFEDEAQQKIDNLTTALEPILMIVLGAGVGFMVMAIIMPIYNLTSTI